ncbi:MAG: reverse transcriptase family protein [Acinetobacter sp.]
MIQTNSKPKLDTKNKSYSIQDSALYMIKTKNHLARVLLIDVEILKSIEDICTQYNVFPTTGKSNKVREIQTPINFLESIHNRIASLLCRIKTPEFLHSGKKNHSNISNAKVHLGDNLQILTIDIEKFFPSTASTKIYEFFLCGMKCSKTVSKILTQLCTYKECLPTGSRISMPLAYFSNMLMFQEMALLARKHQINMTVYVDDITFSGSNISTLFYKLVKKITIRHQHLINDDKTRFYNKYQPKLITGVILKGNTLLIRNKHHKELYEFKELYTITKDNNPTQLSEVRNKLIGKLYSCGVINVKYKNEAKIYQTCL